MFMTQNAKEQVPIVHTGHDLIYITDKVYGFIDHVFCSGSVTTIEWGVSGVVYLSGCIVHTGATVIVLGNCLQIEPGTIFHQGSQICGRVMSMDCFTRIPDALHIKIINTLMIYAEENDWDENELDKICIDGRNVEYYHDLEGVTITRFNNRMQANYKFYASHFIEFPYPCAIRKHRAISHSLLAMVSARGRRSRSPLRKLPWYLLKMCGEFLV